MAKKSLKVANITTVAEKHPEVHVNNLAMGRMVSCYLDEMVREAIRTEIETYAAQGDDSVNLKKVIQEQVRTYLTKEMVRTMVGAWKG